MKFEQLKKQYFGAILIGILVGLILGFTFYVGVIYGQLTMADITQDIIKQGVKIECYP